MSGDNILTLAGVPLNELHRIRSELRVANSAYTRSLKMISARLTQVNEAIRAAETPMDSLLVSDHAVVRWLERVEGMDLEPIRARMRQIAEGRYDPHADHEVIVSEEDKAVLIIRGRVKLEDTPPCIATVLDVNGVIPEKGQLAVMPKDAPVNEHQGTD